MNPCEYFIAASYYGTPYQVDGILNEFTELSKITAIFIIHHTHISVT